jgi:hypothetical protein
MFFDNIVSIKENLVSDEEQPQTHSFLVRVVRNLQSKLKDYLFSPYSISGMYFYLDSEDEK